MIKHHQKMKEIKEEERRRELEHKQLMIKKMQESEEIQRKQGVHQQQRMRDLEDHRSSDHVKRMLEQKLKEAEEKHKRQKADERRRNQAAEEKQRNLEENDHQRKGKAEWKKKHVPQEKPRNGEAN